MKRILFLLAAIIVIASIDSCTKDKVAVQDCSITSADTINTYTNSVKSIMDLNCAYGGCHDAATAFSGVVLDNYENTVANAKNQPKFFCVIDHSCTPVMPYFLPKMADSLIIKIEAWRENCYAE